MIQNTKTLQKGISSDSQAPVILSKIMSDANLNGT